MSKYLAQLKELESEKNIFIPKNELTKLTLPTKEGAFVSFGSNVSSHTEEKNNFPGSEIEKIREWLHRIGEPKEDHKLVLDKCRNDPQALEYYLKHTQGEFDTKPALAGNDPPNVESISKDEAVRIIGNWMIAGGRPPADYLFRLIVEKCENDPAARAHFLREALASEARRQSVINEKVVSLADHDDRRKCADCAFLDRGGYCQQWKRTNPHNLRYRPVQDVLRRCHVFKTKEDR